MLSALLSKAFGSAMAGWRLIWFEESAHLANLEEPARFQAEAEACVRWRLKV